MDVLVERLSKIERGPRIALACHSAVRIQPVYDACWGGHHDPAYAEAVELAWQHAEAGAVDPSTAARVEAALRDLVDSYYDEVDYALLAKLVTVALRVVEALADDEAASALAVARALYSSLDVAGSAEAETRPPGSSEPEEAEEEEKAWQDAAIGLAEAWRGPASRGMFDTIPPAGGPRWLQDRLAKGLWSPGG